MRDGGWETIDHTGDVGVEVWGRSRTDLFVFSVRAMYALCIEGEPTEGDRETALDLEAESYEALLFEWLREIHARLVIDGVVYARFEFDRFDMDALEVRLIGEDLDPDRHRPFTEIKAVTWHDLIVCESDEGWRARVIFDV